MSNSVNETSVAALYSTGERDGDREIRLRAQVTAEEERMIPAVAALRGSC